MAVDFKGWRFAKDVILQCVRLYLAHRLSYQKIEEMMAELGLCMDHTWGTGEH